MLKLRRLGLLFTVWALVMTGLGFSGCGSSGDGGGNNGGGTVSLDATGEYFVTKLFGTNTQDVNNVVDAQQKGLSLYMTLNADNTLTAGAQTPDKTPKVVTLTGTWSIDSSNNLTLNLIDNNSQQRTIVGVLSQDASGNVTFEGKQTDGATLQLDDTGAEFTISTLGMVQYDHPLTLADIAGNYQGTSSVAISNLDNSLTVDLLPPGDSFTVVINSDGSGSATQVSGGQQESQNITFAVADSFHLIVTIDQKAPQTTTFRFVNGVLTDWNYESNETFQSVQQSATDINVFTRQ